MTIYPWNGEVHKDPFPDATYREYGYAANGLDLLNFRDERGKIWTYTVDAASILLRQVDQPHFLLDHPRGHSSTLQ